VWLDTSSVLFRAQRLHWVDERCATRRQQAREQRDGGEQNRRSAEQSGIVNTGKDKVPGLESAISSPGSWSSSRVRSHFCPTF